MIKLFPKTLFNTAVIFLLNFLWILSKKSVKKLRLRSRLLFWWKQKEKRKREREREKERKLT